MDTLSILSSDIAKRMQMLCKAPAGVLHSRDGAGHRIFVVKDRGQIRLHFFDPKNGEIESRFDPAHPLVLVSPYTQGMMLALLWNQRPRRVHVLGLGGGRLPMILHHHYPAAQIDCTEIDPDVVAVAREYFGLITDDRLRVAVQDGRDFLAGRRSRGGYDLILIDAFSGFGFGSVRMATCEFLALCAAQLSATGVVATNVIANDVLFLRRLKTMTYVFRNVYLLAIQNSAVLFGDNGDPLGAAERARRADAIQRSREFEFPFARHLENMIALGAIR